LQSRTRKRDYDDTSFLHQPDWSILLSRYLDWDIHIWWISGAWMWAISGGLEVAEVSGIVLKILNSGDEEPCNKMVFI